MCVIIQVHLIKFPAITLILLTNYFCKTSDFCQSEEHLNNIFKNLSTTIRTVLFVKLNIWLTQIKF